MTALFLSSPTLRRHGPWNVVSIIFPENFNTRCLRRWFSSEDVGQLISFEDFADKIRRVDRNDSIIVKFSDDDIDRN